MNEEEILKNINEMITLIDDECYISIPEDIESIKGLFYLYNKYKKENKKLQKENKELKENSVSKKEIKKILRRTQDYDLSYKDTVVFNILINHT